MKAVSFAEELERVLPSDLPHRVDCIVKCAKHLESIVEMNRQFNLTRVTEPREAVIKHVLDSILPWRLFAHSGHVVDAGTGAGFPGIPLALVLPDTRFTLLDSTQKKARFVQEAVASLGLPNVKVASERAEDWIRKHTADVLTARAVAPLERFIPMFGRFVQAGGRILLYKGPDADSELTAAAVSAKRARVRAGVVDRYALPEGYGSRAIIEIAAALTSPDASGKPSGSV